MSRFVSLLLVVFVLAIPVFAKHANTADIVYENQWLGQTSNIGTTTIFTPSVDGLFRLNTAVSGSGGLHVIIDTNAPSQNCLANNLYGPPGCVVVFQGTSGTAITIDTRILDPGTSYDAYVTLEQLQ